MSMRIRCMEMILLVGGLLAGSLALNAEEALLVHVPFAFVAADRAFPAGEYRVNKNGSGSVILLQGAGHSVVFLTVAAEPDVSRDAATLVFERRGASMVLSAIRMPGERDRVLLAAHVTAKAEAIGLVSTTAAH